MGTHHVVDNGEGGDCNNGEREGERGGDGDGERDGERKHEREDEREGDGDDEHEVEPQDDPDGVILLYLSDDERAACRYASFGLHETLNFDDNECVSDLISRYGSMASDYSPDYGFSRSIRNLPYELFCEMFIYRYPEITYGLGSVSKDPEEDTDDDGTDIFAIRGFDRGSVDSDVDLALSSDDSGDEERSVELSGRSLRRGVNSGTTQAALQRGSRSLYEVDESYAGRSTIARR